MKARVLGVPLALLVVASYARADVPAPQAEASPKAATSPALTRTRIKYLRQLLDSESRASATWTWAWVGTYAAITAGQVVPIPFIDDPGTRTDLWVGSISSLIGAVGLALAPLNIPSGANLPADPDAALAELERRVHLGAEQERLGQAWYLHAANAGVNLVIGLVLGVGFGRWDSGLLSFGLGFLVGEITLLTQPTRLIEAESAWNAGVHPTLSVEPLGATGQRTSGLALCFRW